MELITIYTLALTWCGLGMIGAQKEFNWFHRLWGDMPEEWDARKGHYAWHCFMLGLLGGPIMLLFSAAFK